MESTRFLIVNADDLGQDRGINRGIAEAQEHGIVSSASLMVRWPAAVDASRLAQSFRIGIGLHVDLGEWRLGDGRWIPVYEVVPPDDRGAVEKEIRRQIEQFRDLMQADPTHLDSHQHVHLREPARTLLIGMAEELGIPLRSLSGHARYCGDFYGQTSDGAPAPDAIEPRALCDLVLNLPQGVTELACHPGRDVEVQTMYKNERATELRALCDPAVRAAISEARVVLCSFADRPWEESPAF